MYASSTLKSQLTHMHHGVETVIVFVQFDFLVAIGTFVVSGTFVAFESFVAIGTLVAIGTFGNIGTFVATDYGHPMKA